MRFVILTVAALAIAQARGDVTPEERFGMLRHGLPPAGPPHERAATPQWGSITMRLDNFDQTNKQVFSMRFMSNDQYFKAGGPIFIMLGAEWTIDASWLQSGQMYDIARQTGAMMYYTEHRYYGQSIPTKDLSTANLKYLTTPQALADVASFIRWVKSKPEFASSKVVVFGGSYGGNMAIWMREQYPDIVHAAMSSSAPVLAKADFTEYFEVVQSSLKDPACYNVIKNAVARINQLISSGSAGIKKVSQDFNTCKTLSTNVYDLAYFYQSMGNLFAGLVQYSTVSSNQRVCRDLTTPPELNDYDRLVTFVKNNRPGCLGDYNNFVRYFANPNTPGNSRQWIFQTCNEYGFFQSSSSRNNPFYDYFPVSLNYRMCLDVYGAGFDAARVQQAVAATNARYGGLNPRVTRVISVHGTLDPWHALGLSQNVNKDAPVIVVPDYSHCADLYSISGSDSPAMRAAKQKEQDLIKQWLKEP